MPNAQDFAFALGAQFPNLTPSDLNLHQEPDADLARVEWQDWTALFPQSETAAQATANHGRPDAPPARLHQPHDPNLGTLP